MYICIYSVEAPSHPTITITLFAPASLPLLFSYFFFRTSRGGLASASFQTSPVSSLSFLTIRAALYTYGPFLSRFYLCLLIYALIRITWILRRSTNEFRRMMGKGNFRTEAVFSIEFMLYVVWKYFFI